MVQTIPTEFVTRVDFGKFWEHALQGISPDAVSRRVLLQIKQELIDAEVPALTVVAYFRHLYYVLDNQLVVGLIEEIVSDLEELSDLELA